MLEFWEHQGVARKKGGTVRGQETFGGLRVVEMKVLGRGNYQLPQYLLLGTSPPLFPTLLFSLALSCRSS